MRHQLRLLLTSGASVSIDRRSNLSILMVSWLVRRFFLDERPVEHISYLTTFILGLLLGSRNNTNADAWYFKSIAVY